jgi:hypothetical protein
MPMTYRVHVLRRSLSAQFQVNGQAERWLDRLGRRMFTASRNAAPSRTNTLRNAHRLAKPRGINQFACDIRIENLADHAAFVHGGTSTIYPEDNWLFLPPGGPGRNTTSPYAGQSFPGKRLRSVAGQAPNPWLDDACTRIAKSVGAIEYG